MVGRPPRIRPYRLYPALPKRRCRRVGPRSGRPIRRVPSTFPAPLAVPIPSAIFDVPTLKRAVRGRLRQDADACMPPEPAGYWRPGCRPRRCSSALPLLPPAPQPAVVSRRPRSAMSHPARQLRLLSRATSLSMSKATKYRRRSPSRSPRLRACPRRRSMLIRIRPPPRRPPSSCHSLPRQVQSHSCPRSTVRRRLIKPLPPVAVPRPILGLGRPPRPRNVRLRQRPTRPKRERRPAPRSRSPRLPPCPRSPRLPPRPRSPRLPPSPRRWQRRLPLPPRPPRPPRWQRRLPLPPRPPWPPRWRRRRPRPRPPHLRPRRRPHRRRRPRPSRSRLLPPLSRRAPAVRVEMSVPIIPAPARPHGYRVSSPGRSQVSNIPPLGWLSDGCALRHWRARIGHNGSRAMVARTVGAAFTYDRGRQSLSRTSRSFASGLVKRVRPARCR